MQKKKKKKKKNKQTTNNSFRNAVNISLYMTCFLTGLRPLQKHFFFFFFFFFH